jgi:DNA-directed RNA polymerase II subunit RPB2
MNKEELPWNLIKSYFMNYSLANLQIESYNFFICHELPKLLSTYKQTIFVSKSQCYKIEFHNLNIDPPFIYDEQHNKKWIYPHEARIRDLTYEATVFVDIFIELLDTNSNMVIQSQIYPKIHLFNIPVMLRSSLCSLVLVPNDKFECEYDVGGYFIIKGKERVLVAQERINYNQVHVYYSKTKYIIYSEIRSIKEDAEYSVLFQLKMTKDQNIFCGFQYVNQDIPLAILIRALNIDIMKFFEMLDLDGHNYLEFSKFKSSLLIYQFMSNEDAINYISQFTVQKMEDSIKQRAYTLNILKYESLPHLGYISSSEDIIWFIIYMLEHIFDLYLERRIESDRDHNNNKRIDMSGHLIGYIVRTLFKKSMKNIQQSLETKKNINIPSYFSKTNITKRLYSCFTTSNWGIAKSNYIRQGVSQVLDRKNLISTYSHLRRLVIPIGKESKNIQLRQLHSSTYGFYCNIETPDGMTTGVVKNFALLTRVSENIDIVYVQEILEQYCSNLFVPKSSTNCKILLNGIWIYSIDKNEISPFIEYFKQIRDSGILPFSVSINCEMGKYIQIHSDCGRVLRAVYKNQHELQKSLENIISTTPLKDLWKVCEKKNIIEYVDSYEAESSYIGLRLEENKEYDLIEIHPSMMFGLTASLIPFPNFAQGPRNIYATAMYKQAIGHYSTTEKHRFDTAGLILQYPQKSIVTTKTSTIFQMNEMPYGTNVIVAIAVYGGANQEDSILLNKSSVDRGLFRSFTLKTVIASEVKNGTHDSDIIEIPIDKLKQHSYNYSLLQNDGIVRIGQAVKEHDVLVGVVAYKQLEPVKDCSVVCKFNEEGIVNDVVVTYNEQGYKHVKVKISKLKIPEMGDKFASIAKQKGTAGLLVPQEDMPFTKDGICPDVVLNPHALPSRMTISLLLELISGKAGAFSGEIQDSTAFEHSGDEIVEKMGNILQEYGLESTGDEYLTNGMTGEVLKSKIFMGIGYYQRLKHLVSEKIHCLTPDHEILTEKGWKLIEELTKYDKVATLVGDKLVYSYPKKIFIYPNYEGKLYVIDSQTVNLQVTDNHRMWVNKDKYNDEFEFVEAKNVFEKNVKYRKNAKWLCKSYNISNELIVLYSYMITCNEKERFEKKCEEDCDKIKMNLSDISETRKSLLYNILKELNISYIYSKKIITIYTNNVYLKYPNTSFAPWVWKLNRRQSRFLVTSLMQNSGIINGDTWIFNAYSKQIADDFMRLSLHAGGSSINTLQTDNKTIQCQVLSKKSYHPGEKVKEEIIDYKGKVVCIGVDSEIFYVRRDGKPVWTGNSRARGNIQNLSRQPCAGRAKEGGLRVGDRFARVSVKNWLVCAIAGNIFKLRETLEKLKVFLCIF